jgi:hypothetical protein
LFADPDLNEEVERTEVRIQYASVAFGYEDVPLAVARCPRQEFGESTWKWKRVGEAGLFVIMPIGTGLAFPLRVSHGHVSFSG